MAASLAPRLGQWRLPTPQEHGLYGQHSSPAQRAGLPRGPHVLGSAQHSMAGRRAVHARGHAGLAARAAQEPATAQRHSRGQVLHVSNAGEGYATAGCSPPVLLWPTGGDQALVVRGATQCAGATGDSEGIGHLGRWPARLEARVCDLPRQSTHASLSPAWVPAVLCCSRAVRRPIASWPAGLQGDGDARRCAHTGWA